MTSDLDPREFYRSFAETNEDGVRLSLYDLAKVIADRGYTGYLMLDRGFKDRLLVDVEGDWVRKSQPFHKIVTISEERTEVEQFKDLCRIVIQVYGSDAVAGAGFFAAKLLPPGAWSLTRPTRSDRIYILQSKWHLPLKGKISPEITTPVRVPIGCATFEEAIDRKFSFVTHLPSTAKITELEIRQMTYEVMKEANILKVL